jgi:2-octaprenylphenol hydroxylase
MTEISADVAVAGGGLVGATLALGLARRGKRVALIDRAVPVNKKGKLGFDIRTVALNQKSAGLLDALGVWRDLAKCPFQHMRVWESLGTRSIEFAAADVGADQLGWIVEVGQLTFDLWQVLQTEPNIRVMTGGSIVDVLPGPGKVTVVTDELRIEAALLIAADGGHSAVRRLLGVGATELETGHSALASVVETECPHEGSAVQVFLPDGPLAFLPLPDRQGRHFSAIVWSQPQERAEARVALEERAFAMELQRAGERCLGEILDVDARVAFGLTQRIAEQFAPCPRVLLAGDAARVLHPLAGQGVNLGFEDVAEVLEIAGTLPADALAEPGLWRGYARRRRLRAEILVRAMDAFRMAYGNANPWFGWLRNVGVDLVNASPAIKTQLIKEAMGIGPLARTL